jgi:hypothetical protein
VPISQLIEFLKGAACVIISRITQLQSFPTILFESMRAI